MFFNDLCMSEVDLTFEVSCFHETASAATYLPDDVCQAIATEWLGLPTPDNSGTAAQTPSGGKSRRRSLDMYCPDHLDLDDHDILFTFVGEHDRVVDFRCTASRFLNAGWREPGDRGWAVPIVGQPVDPVEPSSCILGQVEFFPSTADTTFEAYDVFGKNFFWTAFVRFDCSFRGDLPIMGDGTDVHVRLAPQRMVDSQGNVMDEKSIGFHKLPGRLEALRSGSTELKYDD